MLGVRKVECLFCGKRIRRRDARATKGAVEAFVCDTCYAEWVVRAGNVWSARHLFAGCRTWGCFSAARRSGTRIAEPSAFSARERETTKGDVYAEMDQAGRMGSRHR